MAKFLRGITQFIGRWQTALKLLLGIGLIVLVLSLIDFRELVSIILQTNPWYLVAFFGLFYIDRLIMAYKWDLLLRALGIRIPFSLVLQTYIVAPLSGTLLPATIGGDIFRLYNLSRYKLNNKAVLASMVVERLIAMVATLILAAFGLGLGIYLIKDGWVTFKGAGLLLLIGILITASVIVMMQGIFRGGIERFVERLKPYPGLGVIALKLHQIYLLCYEYQNHSRTLTSVSAWTVLEQMVPVAGNLLMVFAFRIQVSPLELIVIIPIIILAIRLPISLDGLGIQEGLYVALFGMVGVSPSQAFLMSTVGRVVPMLAALPWGVQYILGKDRHRFIPDDEKVP